MARRLLAVAVLIALNAGVELALQGADLGLWGSPLWRPMAYQFGGFWAGLLRDWQPNFAAQPATMFLTYSVLHSGFGHMLGNVAGMGLLGQAVAARVGGRGLVLVYVMSSLAGAAVFGILSASAAPMVGASGAVFGLAGVLVVWDSMARRRFGRRGRLPGLVLVLVATNVVLWVAAAGNLAWEAHLGGFLMGAALAGFGFGSAKSGGAGAPDSQPEQGNG